ncbi:DUF1885 family protein [Bacillus marinisedimentorum]|uniref:DUF1885 family protein n=1 Tax=Bacillus marinisedimentorum TaxID=1821260 RepID=UPI0007DFBF7F|nr:DUF1885 family protein [Bacillus marinisedimentorum]
MGKSAFIKLVPASLQTSITLDEVKDFLHYYKDITHKTGEQLGWSYDEAAFPYAIKERSDSEGKWFYLKSDEERYYMILVGIGEEKVESAEEEDIHTIQHIQITLPDGSTQGDFTKAIEFAKFLSKKLQGELHLFNGRIMYYYKRK